MGSRLCDRVASQAAYMAFPGSLIELFVIIYTLVLHCMFAAAQFIQKLLCHFLRQKIPFPYISRSLTAPVVEHPADNMHSCLLILLPQCPHIFVLVFCRYPDSGLHITGQSLPSQGIQPFSRYVQLPCLQIPSIMRRE